jgi:hypothetical protein
VEGGCALRGGVGPWRREGEPQDFGGMTKSWPMPALRGAGTPSAHPPGGLGRICDRWLGGEPYRLRLRFGD